MDSEYSLNTCKSSLHTPLVLVTYGQLFSVVKLLCLKLAVIMCNMDYIFIDVIVVMAMSYVMTKSGPKRVLQPRRPTSSLLGPETVASVVGMQAIHLLFLLFAFVVIWNDPDYVPWPAHLSKGAQFWVTGDNWETTVMFCIFAAQFCSAAMTFSFGGHYRAPIWENWGLVGLERDGGGGGGGRGREEEREG